MQPVLKILQENFYTPKQSYEMIRWFKQFSPPSGEER